MGDAKKLKLSVDHFNSSWRIFWLTYKLGTNFLLNLHLQVVDGTKDPCRLWPAEFWSDPLWGTVHGCPSKPEEAEKLLLLSGRKGWNHSRTWPSWDRRPEGANGVGWAALGLQGRISQQDAKIQPDAYQTSQSVLLGWGWGWGELP